MVTRTQILSITNTYDILNHFLRQYHNKSNLREGENIDNPLISHKQKTPSFNIYHSSKGIREWRYKDFTGMDGSAFDLVMNLYNVNFKESMNIIDKEMNLGLSGSKELAKEHKRSYVKKPEPVLTDDRNYDYVSKHVQFTSFDRSLFAQYGITRKGLRKYDVYCVSSFTAYNKDNKEYTFNRLPNQPIYEYRHEGWSKIYMPFSDIRFLTLGDKPDNYLFGYKQLPQLGDVLYLTGGEKDVMTLNAHGFHAVCLNSEESNPINYPQLIKLLYGNNFKEKYILYDNDKTGIKQMKKLSKEFPMLKPLILPQMSNGNKDISDWYKLKYSKFMF